MYAEAYKRASQLADMIRDGTYTVNKAKEIEEESSSFFSRRKPLTVEEDVQTSELDMLAEMIAVMRGQAQNDQQVVKSLRPTSRGDMVASEIGTQLMKDLMADFGLTKGAAAGIVGNLDHETGGFKHMQELEPVIKGSKGGWGYAQWTGPRRKEFESWADAEGLDITTYDANYGNLKRELTQTPEGRVIDKLKGVEDPGESAKIFSDMFLRPGVKATDSRVARAYGYMEANLDD